MRHRWLIANLAAALLLWGAAPGCLAGAPAAQKKKKRKDQTTEQKLSGAGGEGVLAVPDDQAIETEISQMLGAWQVGNTELMHKYYADDVTVVSGLWEPPLVGWANYLRAYERQRERMTSGRLDRSNTLILAKGSIAWATYQWDFGAVVDGRATAARGQTTLIFEKRGDRWLIVHNHTSMVPEMKPAAPAQQPAAPKPNPPGN